MKKKYITPLVLTLSLFFVQPTFGQTKLEREKISSRYDKSKLSQLQHQFSSKATTEKQRAVQIAASKGIPLILKEANSYAELQKILPDGTPLYYTTFNVNASKSTRANHLNAGGSLGLNLMGQNMTAHVWDGGLARTSHVEYGGAGGSNRFSIGDGTTALNYHSAHVTGTIIAAGVDAAAKGMAPYAKAVGYDWNNDLSEATTAAANGMLISNHSYGYRSDMVPDQYFGAYIEDGKDWDELMFNSPNYLMVVAAGNDGSTNYNAEPLNGQTAYDKLTGHATAKNNMVVANANDANIDANGNLVSVTINTSSSQGPTDDYRIKPDITGNGTTVYSSVETSNTAYNTLTGTSMASPNVAGTLLLLQQHANNVRGSYLTAATLKGLALHTADDAGTAGPDAKFGWGLLNAKKAAETITQNGSKSIISELTLNSGQSYQITVNSDGINSLMASISWTDRPGNTVSATNSNTAVLVNDLDIRVSKDGTTLTPWRLTGVTTNDKGDNTKDPYERVDVTGATGTYTITVTNKGTLVGGSQKYSLIVTGLATTAVCNATTPTGLTANQAGVTTASLSWNAISGASYDFRYRQLGASTWTESSIAGATTSLSGLTASTQYEAQVRSKCSDGNTSPYSSSANFTTTSGTDTTAPSTPANLAATGTTQTTTNLTWNASTDNVGVTGYNVYQGSTLIATVTGTYYAVTGLTAATTYNFQVTAKDAAGNVSANSTAIAVTTLPNSNVSYCASKGNNSTYEWIDLVRLNNLDKVSANDGGYKDNTALSANLPYGSNTIYLSAGFSASAYNEFWKIWIDYNQDGTFGSNELVVSGSSSSSATLSASFSVPTSALTGSTRMRVSMKYNAGQTACEAFSYGEVEDYTVNIGQAVASNTTLSEIKATPLGIAPTISDVTLYPNPVKNILNVKMLDSRSITYSIHDISGRLALKGALNATGSINVSVLAQGAYIIKLNDGQKEIVKKFIKE